jgi:hypothetical protein
MPAGERPNVALRRLIDGHKVTQAIRAAVQLGIPDLLAAEPRDAGAIAAAADAHPPSTARLLRALVALGVLEERRDGRFALTAMGEGLRSDAEEPLGAWAVYCGSEEVTASWGDLANSVRTGQTAYEHLHGVDAWEFRATHPDAAERFDRAMVDLARRANRATIEEFDFSRYGTVVDVGGGRGALLAAVLAAQPRAHGILFDLPHVVAGAGPFAPDVQPRVRVESGSFFEEVPPGGDAYMLRAILHDWPDERCAQILEVCRAAMAPGAAVLVIERDLADAGGRVENTLSDLNMLVGLGGRERTVDEYAGLLEGAGFRFDGATPTTTGTQVIAGTAV